MTTPSVSTILASLAKKGIPVSRLSDANLRELGVTREQLLGKAPASAPVGSKPEPLSSSKPRKPSRAKTALSEAAPPAEVASSPASKRTRKAASVSSADKPASPTEPAPKKKAKTGMSAKLAKAGRAMPEAIFDERVRELFPLACASAQLIFKAHVDMPTPSNNELRHVHFATYKKLREHFSQQIAQALGGYAAPMLERSFVVFVRRCGGEGLDWDNLYGGVKPLLDGLVQPSDKNPSGVGIIVDDNPKNMPFPPLIIPKKAKKGEGSTEIYVFRLPADAVSPSSLYF